MAHEECGIEKEGLPEENPEETADGLWRAQNKPNWTMTNKLDEKVLVGRVLAHPTNIFVVSVKFGSRNQSFLRVDSLYSF